MKVASFLVLFFGLLTISVAKAQDTIPLVDTARVAPLLKTDTLKKRHDPRKATIRSAIIPGWGQIYNKKWWKVPIVYAAIGIPVGTFIYNKNWYRKTSDAAKMLAADPPDTANYRNRVDPQLYVFFSNPESSIGALLNYRNEFRRNMDYSVLIALLMWGLNVVDATVDAHLRDFDVSEDISLRIKPAVLNNGLTPGISLVVSFGKQPNRETKRLF